MSRLVTTDNNCGKSFSSLGAEQSDYQNLIKIANTSLKDLTARNASLLVFPHDLGHFGDGIEEQHIFDICGNPEQLASVRLTTGNLMGFVGVDETQLKIASRFSKDDEHDHFLHYMLQKVFAINLLDLKYTIGKNGSLDLLIFLFPYLLKKALAQGLFRQYQTFARNDANIKGVVDVGQHIRRNIPFGGRIAYKSRERTFDNALTELIRHTIEAIKTKPFARALLSHDDETKKCVQEIIGATPSYNAFEREKIIAANDKGVQHPYFTAYRPLQKLCRAILRHKRIGFAESANKAYGILFDGAWLWEEYLATVLTPCGFTHPKNKSSTGGISVYKGNVRYPDFYLGKQIAHGAKDTEIERNFVLDAKYKHLDNHKPGSDEISGTFSRDDLHQLITYMYILPAKSGGLMYPYDKADKRNGAKIVASEPKTVFGHGGTICAYGVPIPVRETYSNFVQDMERVEEEMKGYNWGGEE